MPIGPNKSCGQAPKSTEQKSIIFPSWGGEMPYKSQAGWAWMIFSWGESKGFGTVLYLLEAGNRG